MCEAPLARKASVMSLGRLVLLPVSKALIKAFVSLLLKPILSIQFCNFPPSSIAESVMIELSEDVIKQRSWFAFMNMPMRQPRIAISGSVTFFLLWLRCSTNTANEHSRTNDSPAVK